MTKPNLFLIGAMKSGTTYLAELLGGHPDIFMCSPKEPSYFVEPGELSEIYHSMWEKGFWKSPGNYLALFEEGATAAIRGEASTNYTKLPRITGVAERIHEFAPEAKLIYVMRDPVERSISHYWWSVWREGEDRSPLRAIKEDHHYRAVSHYSAQLEPYFRLFGRDSVKLMTLESLRDDPHRTVQELLTWLEVDDGIVLPGLGDHVHATPRTLHRASPIRRLLREQWVFRAIKGRLPPQLVAVARQLTEVKIARRPDDMKEVIDFLRPVQREQVAELERLVGRDFPEWKTLWGGEVRR